MRWIGNARVSVHMLLKWRLALYQGATVYQDSSMRSVVKSKAVEPLIGANPIWIIYFIFFIFFNSNFQKFLIHQDIRYNRH